VTDLLKVTFPFSAVEQAEALSESTGQRNMRWWLQLCGIVIAGGGLFAAGLGAAFGEPLVPLVQNTLPLVALGAFWFWGAPVVLRFIQVGQLRREGAQDGIKEETRMFGREGFTPTARWSPPVPWSSVDKVVETKRFILIYASSDGPFYLPKHAFTPADLARLKALLQEEFRTRPKQLIMLPRAT